MNKKTTGFALALSAGILWGVSGTCAQFLFQHRGVTTEWLVTVRLLGAGVLLLGRAAAGGGRGGEAIETAGALAGAGPSAGARATVAAGASIWDIWRRDAVALLLFSIFGVVAVQYTYFAAIRASNVATATVLQYLGPPMIAAYFAVLHRRWPRPYEYGALACALAGTFLLVTHGSFHSLSISPVALFWGLASAVAMVFYTIQPTGLLARYKASIVIGWAMVVGGVFFSFVSPPWHVPGSWDAPAWGCLGVIVLLGTLAAFYSYLTAVQWIGAQSASLLVCAEPVAAAALAVGWLHVPLFAADWAGMGCILGTILLLTLGDKAKELPHAEPI
ncbi:DMT family transporter [Dinghuibacter silviterrae]|uniref:Drug/metabolite transporter (DMT)-like permease n=1 Tax=Dinghuibacter silviterrae TaxID=1539049 RepID=A0A4V3GM45_9BACT|nr:EamA family transporter [Dinghuibacter silviterrae]TDX02013.1 drug/metabolite transporter (DMT)-like permease [Dinghuibacter silviterrae]